ncbi:MAG: hypothetical protein ACI841_000671 [Planctomycetota bacterium]|jgi:hypothetical protein
MPGYYLNTDFCVFSKIPLDALRDELGSSLEIASYGESSGARYHLTANARGSGDLDAPRDPDRDIESILEAVNELSAVGATRLSACDKRTMNVGWQSGAERPENSFSVSAELLSAMASDVIDLAVTIYPSSEDERSKS